MFSAALWQHISESVWGALTMLAMMTLIFTWLALIARGKAVFRDMRGAWPEAQVSLSLHFWNILVFMPLYVPSLLALQHWMNLQGYYFLQPSDWAALPEWLVALLALFVGDFITYVRHRIEHWSWLWPMHAIHHSDTNLTWVTLFRQHPLNVVTTGIFDTILLTLMGFPGYALAFMATGRLLYGALVHMNLPWTYGPLGKILVSPAMHRWHHVRSGPGVGNNFATVFAVFDWAGGTHYLPGPCKEPLGVEEDMGRGVMGQLWHPIKVWSRRVQRAQEAPDTPRAVPASEQSP
ncbi:MAG: sterol desaturase family protein [Pseudomonadota bacterium]